VSSLVADQPKTDELMEIARQCKSLAFEFRIDTTPGHTEVSISLRRKGSEWDFRRSAKRLVPPAQSETVRVPPPATTIAGYLAGLGKQLAGHAVDLSTLSVSASGSPVAGAALKTLVVAALKEHFIVAESSSRSDDAVAMLQRGDVTAWNALTDVDRQTAGPFRGLDLSGLALDGIQLRGHLGMLDFEGTNFSRCSLVRADLNARLNRCNFEDANLGRVLAGFITFNSANLTRASLIEAHLTQANFRGASLQSANLTRAELLGADFCGADLRGATLVGVETGDYQGLGTRYDDRTLFPDGFVPGEGWRRVERDREDAS
jgi:hypothetical protein